MLHAWAKWAWRSVYWMVGRGDTRCFLGHSGRPSSESSELWANSHGKSMEVFRTDSTFRNILLFCAFFNQFERCVPWWRCIGLNFPSSNKANLGATVADKCCTHLLTRTFTSVLQRLTKAYKSSDSIWQPAPCALRTNSSMNQKKTNSYQPILLMMKSKLHLSNSRFSEIIKISSNTASKSLGIRAALHDEGQWKGTKGITTLVQEESWHRFA